MNKIVNTRYIFIKKIGEGSFGEVYLIKDDDKYRVAKIEKNNKNRLEIEEKIYKKLRNTRLVPKIYDKLVTDDYNILVMQRLGPSLNDMLKKYGKLRVSTVTQIAPNIINCIEVIHKINNLHHDIKPDNFLIGTKHKDRVYMIDFGLSRPYKVDNKHVTEGSIRSLIGTMRYVSANVHDRKRSSRRDDLISIGYMMVYLCRGRLPWQGMKKKNAELVSEIKKTISIKELCMHLPDAYDDYFRYCLDLEFDEEPDYNYLRSLFRESIEKYDFTNKFEWM